MHLNKQQKAIYEYLRDNGEATIVELRNALYIAKPDMRISEVNRMHQEAHGEPLIITKYKKKNGEHVKTLAKPLTRTVTKVRLEERNGQRVAVPYQEVLPI